MYGGYDSPTEAYSIHNAESLLVASPEIICQSAEIGIEHVRRVPALSVLSVA